jgi:hypothetical protein
MQKRIHIIITGLLWLAVLSTACSPGLPELTPIIGTAVLSTVEPIILTEPPPGYTPPPSPTQTPLLALPGGLGPSELKYRLLEAFPDFFFCDPDYYPVARDNELELALQRFAEIQANPEEFAAILDHTALAGLDSFTEAQKLLIYQEHKRLAAIPLELSSAGYTFQMQVAKTEGQGELVSGFIDSQGHITVQQRQPTIVTCPICLAAGTLIDTPQGPLPVQKLRLGTLVWTVGSGGKRVAQSVIALGKTVMPPSHRFVHLLLADGREAWVSPGHPTADGRAVGHLQAGDRLDGSAIVSAERVSHPADATYDLLPAGETGLYWANGILLRSSLQLVKEKTPALE